MQVENSEQAEHWIQKLNLQPHPEGGFYSELYRSNLRVNRIADAANKSYSACTSIYYLLEGNDFSSFHRLASDEIWYFHKGAPLFIHLIDNDGNYTSQELSDQETGVFSFRVEAGIWFAASIPGGIGYTLVSCVVAPGFEFAEFKLANKDQLISLYPQHTQILNQWCRE